MIRLKYMYWRLCRATVRVWIPEPRSGQHVAATTEVCFGSPIHALMGWARNKCGGVLSA